MAPEEGLRRGNRRLQRGIRATPKKGPHPATWAAVFARFSKREYDKAIADFTEAIRIDPGSSGSYTGRGLARFDKNEFDKSIVDFNAAICINPRAGVAYRFRGLAWTSKGECDKAIADFEVAIRLGPDDTLVHRGRGIALDDEEGIQKGNRRLQ